MVSCVLTDVLKRASTDEPALGTMWVLYLCHHPKFSHMATMAATWALLLTLLFLGFELVNSRFSGTLPSPISMVLIPMVYIIPLLGFRASENPEALVVSNGSQSGLSALSLLAFMGPPNSL